jgi:hypothetical protein
MAGVERIVEYRSEVPHRPGLIFKKSKERAPGDKYQVVRLSTEVQ